MKLEHNLHLLNKAYWFSKDHYKPIPRGFMHAMHSMNQRVLDDAFQQHNFGNSIKKKEFRKSNNHIIGHHQLQTTQI